MTFKQLFLNTAMQLLKYHFIYSQQLRAKPSYRAKWRSSQCLDWCQHVWGHQAYRKLSLFLLLWYLLQFVVKHAHFYIL